MRQALASGGLATALAFVLTLVGLQSAAETRVVTELERRGMPVERLMVGPVPADPLSWDVVVDQGDVLRHGRYRWRSGGSLELEPDPLAAAKSSPLWAEIESSGESPGFVGWVRFPWLEHEAAEAGARAWVMDARYVRKRTVGFGAEIFDLRAGAPSNWAGESRRLD